MPIPGYYPGRIYPRRLGYSAKAHYAPYYDIVVLPVLLWAGLGEMRRIGDSVLHAFMGYGNPDYKNKWWFDLEDENGDGVLTISKNGDKK
jgi:hypothetical protein